MWHDVVKILRRGSYSFIALYHGVQSEWEIPVHGAMRWGAQSGPGEPDDKFALAESY